MLALAGTFIFVSVSQELNDSIDEGLSARTDSLIEVVAGGQPERIELGDDEDPEDSFSQIIRADGTLVDSTSPFLEAPVLDDGSIAAVEDDEVGTDVGRLPGVDGDARLLARPAEREGESFVVVAGAATQDRDETRAGLARTFAIAAPLALLIASAAGYALATVAMRPVERMRRQASAITLEQGGERLPLPATRDEINRLGRTLNDMLARIEASLVRERSFVADASHELRTPLAIIRSELELGLRPDRDPGEARAAMLSVQEEVRRLQRLTEELLALARADGPLSIEREPVSPERLLEGLEARFGPRVSTAGRRLTIVSAASSAVELDSTRIGGAIGNLIENALRHGAGEIVVSGREDGDAVLFEVSDEGAGFPEGFREAAFDRFARAESGRTTPGHGLGLAIVKAVAEAHGGTVTIDPAAFGARVILRIPRQANGGHRPA